MEELDLRKVLIHTIRRAPVRTGGDAERTLDGLNEVRDGPEEYIEMPRDDFDWMKAHFKEIGHNVWLAPDAAFLFRYLEEVVQTSPPTGFTDR